MSEPVVNITFADMYTLLSSVDRKVSDLVGGAERMEERIADHEARLRVVERREDSSRKLAELDASLKRLDHLISRFGERMGAVEADLATIKDHEAAMAPTRVNPVSVIAVVVAALAVVTTILIEALRV